MKKAKNTKTPKFVKQRKKIDPLQVFANLYYVLQYLLVHYLYFGFTFEPVKLVPKIITAFHWQDILKALYNFKDVFMGGFAFGSVLMFIVLAIPYAIFLIWSAKYIIIYVFVLFQLFVFCVVKIRQRRHDRLITLDNIVVVKIGAPGQGKSSSGLYEALIMSRKMWAKLIEKHYVMKDKVNGWRKDKIKNAAVLREWDEVNFSYNYFKKHNCVPCLMTNIPVRVDGFMTSKVKKKHIEQRSRLPAYTVLFLDEVGAMMSVDTAKQRMSETEEARLALAVSDFFRLIRHFINGRCICTEQDSENIYIDVRRVVSFNEYMLSQRWVLKPYLFIAVASPLKWFIIKTERFSKVLAPPHKFLQKLISYIGFRKYRYLRENNTERVTGMQTGKKTFYLNSKLPFDYDDRTFSDLYNGKDEICEPEIFDKMKLENDPETVETFKRQRPQKTKMRVGKTLTFD